MRPQERASQAWRSLRQLGLQGSRHRWPGGRSGPLLWNSSWPWAQGVAGALHSGPPSGGIDARCLRQNLHFLASAKASQARGHCGPHQKVELREPGLQSSQKFCWGICVDCRHHVMYTGRHAAPSISCWNYSHRGPPMDSFGGAICSKWMVDPSLMSQERRCQPSLNTWSS